MNSSHVGGAVPASASAPGHGDAPLVIDGLKRTYVTQAQSLDVLRGVDLTVRAGELVALVGPSGSGKSSLLQAAGLLDKPDGGRVLINGRSALGLSDYERTRLRCHEIGFVYQSHHLLPEFTALENVIQPQLIAGTPVGHARQRAVQLLRDIGLGERLTHRPASLSGGEQQRVAFARALANGPSVLLADEPTGNLDHANTVTVFETLRGLVKSQGVAALVATHNMALAGEMDRVVSVKDGLVVAQ